MTADRNEALRLADAARIAELEQALDRLQGNYLIAFERGRIAGIAEMESRVHTCGPACSKAGCINSRLTAERDQHKHTATSLLSLLADIRMACGDNGKRMQPELVEFIGAMKAERDQLRAEVERLRPNAERYEWLRDNHESEWAICEWQDDPDGLGYYRDARASHIVDAAIDAARTTHKDERASDCSVLG